MPNDSTMVRQTQGQSVPIETDPRGKSILIADRDFREGGMIRNSLEACGYDVSVWSDAVEARERLRLRSYDVVVMSTNLDKSMDGLIEDLRPKTVPPKV